MVTSRSILLGSVLYLVTLFAPTGLVIADNNTLIETAEARAIMFLKNAHTGRSMRAKDWLTAKMRSSSGYRDFGGISSIVRSSTKRANQFGGLRDIRVVRSSSIGKDSVEVEVEMEFQKSPKGSASGLSVDNEEMRWTMKVFREDGKLKLEF